MNRLVQCSLKAQAQAEAKECAKVVTESFKAFCHLKDDIERFKEMNLNILMDSGMKRLDDLQRFIDKI